MRIWGAEAVGTALLVLAIVLAAALTLGVGSPVAAALPGPGARFLALGMRALLPGDVAASIGGAVTHPTVPTAAALALEAGMTAVLLGAIFAFVSSPRTARWTPLAVVPVLTALIWLGSPPTGASLNPARSGGPALAFADLTDLWVYLAAPSAAALTLGGAWRRCSLQPVTRGVMP